MAIRTKRIYDDPSRNDGMRILIDRLWPRGVSKDDAGVDLWAKDVAPSNELRTWFHAGDDRWEEFVRRYRAELKDNMSAVDELIDAIHKDRRKSVTLLTAARDERRSHAVVLKAWLEERL